MSTVNLGHPANLFSFLAIGHGEDMGKNVDPFYGRMSAIGEKLKALGWIEKLDSDRQDIWYEWTDVGKTHFDTFFSDMESTKKFSREEMEFVAKNIFYLGIKTKCEREYLLVSLTDTFDLWGNERLVAVTGSLRSEFKRQDIFDFVSWIYANNDCEIVIYRWNSLHDWVMRIPSGVYKLKSPPN